MHLTTLTFPPFNSCFIWHSEYLKDEQLSQTCSPVAREPQLWAWLVLWAQSHGSREGHSLTHSPSLLWDVSHLTWSHRALTRLKTETTLTDVAGFSSHSFLFLFCLHTWAGPAFGAQMRMVWWKLWAARSLEKRCWEFSAEVIGDALQLLHAQGVNLPRCCCSNAAFPAYFILFCVIPHQVPTL